MSQPAAAALPALLSALVRGSEFAGKTYLVGGCVRDEILGRDFKDVDAVVEESGGAERFANFVSAAFGERVSRPRRLGAGYPIWHLAFKTDVELAGTTYAVAGLELELADTQKEMFPDPASRARITQFGTLAEDCARRDFCCNMLYKRLGTDEVLDPSGRGLADIRAGRLGGHPQVAMEKIFSDDPLRMIRLIRFHCRFGWAIEARCLEALHACRERLTILSAERVQGELLKMTESGAFERGLELMREHGIVDILFPELLPMIGCGQDHIYHSEGDVWVHTLLVIANARKTPLQQLTALLHDIGKPPTRSEHGERVKFLGHEQVSAGLAAAFLAKWKFPAALSRDVLRLTELHLRGGNVQSWKSFRAARKLLRDAGALIEELLLFIEADSRSSLGPEGQPRLEHVALLRETLTRAQAIPPRALPVLDGHEVMRLLDLKPGPRLKEIREFLLELEDRFAERGETLDAESARRAVKDVYAGKPS